MASEAADLAASSAVSTEVVQVGEPCTLTGEEQEEIVSQFLLGDIKVAAISNLRHCLESATCTLTELNNRIVSARVAGAPDNLLAEAQSKFKELRRVEAAERSQAFFASQKIKVYLTTLAGHEFSFDISWDATVRDVKQVAKTLRERTWEDTSVLNVHVDNVKLADFELLRNHIELTDASRCVRLGLIVSPDYRRIYASVVEEMRLRYDKKKCYYITSVTQQDEWAIVSVHFDDDNKDYYDEYLFHLPSYSAQAEPLKHAQRRETEGFEGFSGSKLKFPEPVEARQLLSELSTE